MKIFLALILSLGASATNASDYQVSAFEKLTTYLPIGFYFGKNDKGQECSVSIGEVNYPKKDIQVRVVNGSVALTKLVEENSEFAYRDHKKEFVQTERSLIGVDEEHYVERIIRTVSAGRYKQYVVVSYSVVVNRNTETKVADCVVNL